MKKIIYTIVLISFSFISCDKDITNSVDEKDFVGKWKLVEMNFISAENNSKESQEIITSCKQFEKLKNNNVTVTLTLNDDNSLKK